MPHIKLLETHFSLSQRKMSALLSLSKTPLIAPQFCLLQQAKLVSQVFSGLKVQQERLFEPHSMFVRTLQTDKTVSTDGSMKRNRQEKRAEDEYVDSLP